MTPDHGQPEAADDGSGSGPSGEPVAVQRAFERTPAGVIAFDGPDHVCTAINKAGRELMAGRALVGRPFRATAGSDEFLLGLLDQAYRGGLAVDGTEVRFPIGEGTADRYVTLSVLPVLTPTGVVTGVIAQLRDVTAAVESREAAISWADEVDQRRLAARGFALAVQHALLPEHLPVLPGLRLAAYYQVGPNERAACGDWFDAVPLPGGEVALVAGDVTGHGVRASAAMARLRAALAAFVIDGYDVAETLSRLDRFVARMPEATASTLCLVILDPETGELSYGCAGHPPPLLVQADGSARYLPADRGVPLGTVSAPPRVGHARLGAGDLLMVFTDGLVERSDRSLGEGLEALRGRAAAAVLGGAGSVDEVCRLSLRWALSDDRDDDVSLIAVRRGLQTQARYRREFDAVVDLLPELRADLAAWLDEVGASDLDMQDIQVAVGEAVTNVIEHAYLGRGGPLVVEAYHDPSGRVCVTVADSGVWRPPPIDPDTRGRGLIMIRTCMENVEIDSSETGTTVLMDRRLRKASVLGFTERDVERSGVAARLETGFVAQVHRAPQPLLVVRGPVDAATVAEFRGALADASRGGALPLDVDLTGVTHLASAGVQALYELVEQLASDAHPVRLVAPVGSPVRYVLELTGLDAFAVTQSGGATQTGDPTCDRIV